MLVKLLKNGRLLRFLIILVLCFSNLLAEAQYFYLAQNRKRVTIPFQLVRNMIIVRVKINDKGPFNFILDTGVGIMIITDPCVGDSLNLSNTRTIKLSGFGEGEEYEATVAPYLKVEMHGINSFGVSAAILKKDNFGLSAYAGMPIHGLLGYEFFNALQVKFNFSDSTLVAYRPDQVVKFKKSYKIPITIQDNKPFVLVPMKLSDGTIVNTKLVLDLGAGHPLLINNTTKTNGHPSKCISANLGLGFSGPITGVISRMQEIEFGKYKFKDVLASFPDEQSFNPLYATADHDGNLGLGILKRFTFIMDYPHNAIYVKPNSDMKRPFEHDMSGMQYYAAGDDYKHIIIERVEPGSAADVIGIQKDDEILDINFKPVSKMSLEEIDEIFKSRDDRSLLIGVSRNNKESFKVLTLKRRI